MNDSLTIYYHFFNTKLAKLAIFDFFCESQRLEKTVTERARLLSSRLQAKPGQHHSGLRHKLAILSAIVAERKQRPANET